MTSSAPTIGWYGLGSMGIGMAANLQKHLVTQGLPALHYSNRTLSRGDPLKANGAVPQPDFQSLVQHAGIIFTMISTDDVLDTLIEQAVSMGSLKDKIFVDTSTVHPDTSESASRRLSEQGATFIASPVFGASPVAASGKLIFAMAGPEPALAAVRPFIIDVMARSIINMGTDVRKSSLLKISGNILVITFLQAISEAQVFAELSGLGKSVLEEFIGNMFGPVLESYSRRMTSGAYAPPLDTIPGFAASLAAKDAKHALSIAEGLGTRIPTLETAAERLTRAREYAGECLDSSSIYGIGRMDAGLGFWSENSRGE